MSYMRAHIMGDWPATAPDSWVEFDAVCSASRLLTSGALALRDITAWTWLRIRDVRRASHVVREEAVTQGMAARMMIGSRRGVTAEHARAEAERAVGWGPV